MNEKWFAMSVEQIEKKLKTNAVLGLSLKAARSRASLHKKNTPFFTVKKKRLDKVLLDLFSDVFLVLLTLLAIFSLFFEGNAIIGSAILVLIAINVAVSFFIYYKDVRTLESMSDFFSPTARVIRGGKLYIVDYRDLCEGDVIIVQKGDMLGCDARLVQSDSLRVCMKIDKKTEKIIEKYAGTSPREDELYAENMTNMIHAGSTVLSGSGRAIVTALGQYTYLGAMTGGVTELPSKELPQGLAHLKKECSKIGMIMLMLMLPFCIFSVMFGSFPGGNVLLSEAVLLGLSLGASAFLSRSSNLFISFYVRFVRKLAISENSCIVRSVASLDKLTNADYLFLLDGSIATDGILHFDTLLTADGESANLERMGASATTLCELITLYAQARSSAPSVGAISNGELDIAISELLERSALDPQALKIRCKIHSYLCGVDRDRMDVLSYTDIDKKYEMHVCASVSLLDRCDRVMLAGEQKPLSAEGKSSFKKAYEAYVVKGRTPILISRSDDSGECFVGMMILREGTDPLLAKAISSIRKSGIRIISFSNCVGRENAPEIPDLLRQGSRVYAHDLAVRGIDVRTAFGSYDEYCGFTEYDIVTLAKHVKDQNKGLAICGFTEYARAAIEYADVFISCAPIRTGVFGRFEEEIRALEIPGEHGSSSCTQTVKSEADILLMRPKDSKGGLEPLAIAMNYCRLAYRNLGAFIKYLIFAQLLRLITVGFPMLFGQTVADARHVLILGFLLDLTVMLIFAADTSRGKLSRKICDGELSGFSLLSILKRERTLLLSTLLGGVLCLLLPNLVSMIGVFDNYIYRAEFTFISTAMMQTVLFICVYAGDLLNKNAMKKVYKNKIFIAQILSLTVFVALCLLTPIGSFFGLLANPVIYLLLSFVPPAAVLICYETLSFPKKKA